MTIIEYSFYILIAAYAIGYYRDYKKDKEQFSEVLDFILILVAIVATVWLIYYLFVQ
jgi:hypothetical protein